MPDASIYAEPKTVTDSKKCYFYHTMEIPVMDWLKAIGICGRDSGILWECRFQREARAGNRDIKRLLLFYNGKLGSRSRRLRSFPGYSWDVVPFHDLDYKQHIEKMKGFYTRQNNAFWLCHKAFKSNAKMVYGTVTTFQIRSGWWIFPTFCAGLSTLSRSLFALQKYR